MTTTRNISMNGLGQFFVTTNYGDGSSFYAGPFGSGEAAAGEIAEQEAFGMECEDNDAEQADKFWSPLERMSELRSAEYFNC